LLAARRACRRSVDSRRLLRVLSRGEERCHGLSVASALADRRLVLLRELFAIPRRAPRSDPRGNAAARAPVGSVKHAPPPRLRGSVPAAILTSRRGSNATSPERAYPSRAAVRSESRTGAGVPDLAGLIAEPSVSTPSACSWESSRLGPGLPSDGLRIASTHGRARRCLLNPAHAFAAAATSRGWCRNGGRGPRPSKAGGEPQPAPSPASAT
jgi:hypothetical protein